MVETVTDDELVGDIEDDVVGLDRDFAATGFAEEDGGANGVWMMERELGDDFDERVAGIEDVVDDQDVATLQIGKELIVDHQARCGVALRAGTGWRGSVPRGADCRGDE